LLELLERVRYKNCFLFKYSPRPGTAAAKRYIDDVPDRTKTERLRELHDVQNQISQEDNLRLIGGTVTILVEGPSKKNTSPSGQLQLVGRTNDDKIVVFTGPQELTGQIIHARIDDATALTLFGTMC